MPPNPWKLLRTDELTEEQARDLQRKLTERKDKLQVAFDSLETALEMLSASLDQDGKSKYARKIKRKKKKTKK
jgi:hypothetical protein